MFWENTCSTMYTYLTCLHTFSRPGVTANNDDCYYNQTELLASRGLDTEANTTTSALVWPNTTNGSTNGKHLPTDAASYCVPLPSKVGWGGEVPFTMYSRLNGQV